MLKVKLITVGTLKEDYLRAAAAEYEKRLGAYCRFEQIQLKEEKTPELPSQNEIKAALEGREYTEPTLEEKVDTALLQLRLAIEDKGERVAVPEARKQIASYLHSFRGAASIRARINQALTYSEIERIFKEALKEENT